MKKYQTNPALNVTLLMCVFSAIAFFFSDLKIQTSNPWFELSLMLKGALSPQLSDYSSVLSATYKTFAFALQGVIVSAILGFLLALCFRFYIVRVVCAFVRAIHELFWALLFIQITGLSSLTGFLAILIPYTGIFAKVFSEILEECDKKPERSLSFNTTSLSLLLYTRIILSWSQIKTYLGYRFECGLRSSAILGFVGLPTLGFELESFLKQGFYSEAAGILYLFFMLILSLRYLFKIRYLPFYLIASFIYLPPVAHFSWSLAEVFITKDILPKALQERNWLAYADWCKIIWEEEALEGVFNSLVLAQLALFTTGLLSLILFPFRSSLFASKPTRSLTHFVLIVMRSCPEYLLAFIALLIFGPSMLPAVLALTVHNGSIIAHLLSLQSIQLKFREDLCKGFNLYFFEVLPRLYGNFLALLFYRWEIILRESAILGMLGIPTLGFYIDSAFEDIRFDKAVFLILVSASLNVGVDHISVYLRKLLHIHNQPESL